jgi:hypothetical protein
MDYQAISEGFGMAFITVTLICVPAAVVGWFAKKMITG